MNPSELTSLQVERFIRKITEKYPIREDVSVMTDIHVRTSQESGELLAFNDDDHEITRCVIEPWIANTEEGFYDKVAAILREVLRKNHKTIDRMGILKPFSFVLEDDESAFKAELYVADDDTVILGGDLMQGLDKDLDQFLNDLICD